MSKGAVPSRSRVGRKRPTRPAVAARRRNRRGSGRSGRKRVLASATAALLAIGLGAGVILAVAANQRSPSGSPSSTTSPLSARDQAEHDAAFAWIGAVDDAFGPGLTDTVTAMLTGAPEWERGALSTADFSGRVSLTLVRLVGARDRMIGLPGFPLAPIVKDLTVRSTELSVEVARVYQVAAGMAPGDLRLQLDLQGKRLQQLASRVFDRAQAVLQPYLHQPGPGQTIEPAEVPSWQSAGLAPGPPLEPGTAPGPTTPSRRQATRPTEPRRKWLEAVAALNLPGGDRVSAAIAAGDAGELHRLAGVLQHGADVLGGEADPDTPGGREESARFRLQLLVRADAARAGQLATSFHDDATTQSLTASARRLDLLADGMGPSEVAASPSGLDPGLLTARYGNN